ncbi:MAG TPA: hypothetical protein DCM67_03545 [Propionibacteriaceae bacterium]|nr:hypothetical protein [Propionibacteriaceae bacterium]
MAQAMSLEQLDRFLNGAQEQVGAVARELEEVQTQFVSAHQTSKAVHDAALDELSARVEADLAALPGAVRTAIDERLVVERETLAARRQELAERIVPEAERIADELLDRAQQETARVRALNPRLDQQEEKLKAERGQMETDLVQLNAEIKRLSGCLAVFINFFKISALDRRRNELIGRLTENAVALKDVRDEWAVARSAYTESEQQLKQQWQQASVAATHAREELAQLDDDAVREQLALRRAIFYVLDHWKIPLSGEAQAMSLIDAIDRMVTLNVETDAYEEGLAQVAGLIARLNGIGQGLASMAHSVKALSNEQAMHSAYLRAISVTVDDGVLAFNGQWGVLRDKVRDEKALVANPAEFSALFEAEVHGPLAEQQISGMFDALGSALQAATRGWKG